MKNFIILLYFMVLPSLTYAGLVMKGSKGGDSIERLDPKIALNEMKAINEFVEKLMKEQAYIYSDGMRVKKAQFEEACQSLSE